MEDSNNLFPVFLKLEELDTLIVGGGNVGLEKLNALLKTPIAGLQRVIRKSGRRFSVRSRAKYKIPITFITSDRLGLK